MIATVNPGDVFYDRLEDGRYERCVLQPTTDGTPNRHEAARGGTGQFYRVLSTDEAEEEKEGDELIMDIVEGSPFPQFVVLRPITEGE